MLAPDFITQVIPSSPFLSASEPAVPSGAGNHAALTVWHCVGTGLSCSSPDLHGTVGEGWEEDGLSIRVDPEAA